MGNPARHGIEALAETADGFIWMGTAAGLFRFDGVQFERVEQSGAFSCCLTISSCSGRRLTGGLWIGYRFGGASLLEDGRLTHYSQDEGLPASTRRIAKAISVRHERSRELEVSRGVARAPTPWWWR
jgi:hypothetical protein